jgi:hypothetical protein
VIWKDDEDDGCLLSVSPVNEDTKEFPAEEQEKFIVVAESFLSISPFFGSTIG